MAWYNTTQWKRSSLIKLKKATNESEIAVELKLNINTLKILKAQTNITKSVENTIIFNKLKYCASEALF